MRSRIEIKRGNEVVVQITCNPDISDGDLAAMLTDIEQDLRWNVMRDAETRFIKPPADVA